LARTRSQKYFVDNRNREVHLENRYEAPIIAIDIAQRPFGRRERVRNDSGSQLRAHNRPEPLFPDALDRKAGGAADPVTTKRSRWLPRKAARKGGLFCVSRLVRALVRHGGCKPLAFVAAWFDSTTGHVMNNKKERKRGGTFIGRLRSEAAITRAF
jgi:hypothetical protein